MGEIMADRSGALPGTCGDLLTKPCTLPLAIHDFAVLLFTLPALTILATPGDFFGTG